MTCKPLLLSGKEIEAHLINGKTYAAARPLAEGCGALVCWDRSAEQAHVVPALAQLWESIEPLRVANARWAAEYQMHQARLDHIWAHALRRQVDPRLMLAILLHEDTGSFNTNPANAGDYNGNGPDADWVEDTRRAVSHVLGKLARYHQAVARGGFRHAAATLGYDGSAIQFVNWPGPIWNHEPAWGPYAQHADWWMGVSRFFEVLGGDVRLLTDYWSERRVDVTAIGIYSEAVTDRADLCSDLSGTQPRPGIVARVI